jgi:hypothetical protein
VVVAEPEPAAPELVLVAQGLVPAQELVARVAELAVEVAVEVAAVK